MKHSEISHGKSDKIFTIINYTALTFFLIIILYPLLLIISASFSSPDAVISGKVWLFPVEPSLEGYKVVFEYKKILTGFANSFFYAVFGTLVNVFLTIMAAYSLSRKDLHGRNLVMKLFVFTMLFNAGLIPTYLLVRDLGLLDSRMAMILPGAVAAWNVIIARTFFQTTIPNELLEASRIDGCNDFRFFFKIVIPLSSSIIAVLSLFYGVGHWNQYFQALLYLRSPGLFPLQIILREILIQNQVDTSMMVNVEEMVAKEELRQLLKYSLIVVSSLPVLAIYPFVQKHFVKGVMIGSLKG